MMKSCAQESKNYLNEEGQIKKKVTRKVLKKKETENQNFLR